MKIALLAGLLLLQASIAGNADTTIKIHGSSTVSPINNDLTFSYNEEYGVDFEVGAEGSGVGIAMLLDGTTDIAAASRAMKSSEKATANDSSINDVLELVLAVDALSIITNTANPIETLSIEQITAIYQGNITNWNEVGGADRGITLYERDENSGTHDYFNDFFLDDEEVDNQLSNYGGQAQGNPQLIELVEQDEGAISYVGLAFLNLGDVHGVKIDNVAPSVATALDGTYPVCRDLFYYYRAGIDDDIKAYLNYVVSKDGQDIVLDTGYIPKYENGITLYPDVDYPSDESDGGFLPGFGFFAATAMLVMVAAVIAKRRYYSKA